MSDLDRAATHLTSRILGPHSLYPDAVEWARVEGIIRDFLRENYLERALVSPGKARVK
jgi:hypothetical protein